LKFSEAVKNETAFKILIAKKTATILFSIIVTVLFTISFQE